MMACVEQCASDVVLTPELHAIVSTDVAAGETLKIEAAAGSGKSTALRLFAEHRRDRHILYLTFTKAEAKAKQADYARRGLDHVVVSTLHARAFAATEDLHGGHVVESSRFQAADAARLTSTSAVEWTAARRDALGCAFAAFLASDVDEPCAVHGLNRMCVRDYPFLLKRTVRETIDFWRKDAATDLASKAAATHS